VEACVPCGFGLTSPANSLSITDCYPLNQTCPPGMEIPGGGTGSSTEECQCKPGFGKALVEKVQSILIIGGLSPGCQLQLQFLRIKKYSPCA